MKSSKDPLVSILIPLYNKEMYIEECLKSIQSQTFENWECVIIDDGSTDGSNNLVSEFIKGDERFKLFSQKNAGPSAARNAGLKKADGKYVEFVDADDVIDKTLLEKQLKIMHAENVSVVINPLAEYDTTLDNLTGVQTVDFSSPLNFRDLETNNRFVTDQLPGGPVAKLIEKDFLIKNNISFKKNIKIGEDQLFSLDVYVNAEKIGILNEALYYYKFNSDGLMSSVGKYPTDIVGAYREMKKVLDKKKIFEAWKVSFIAYFKANVEYNEKFFKEDKAKSELREASRIFLKEISPLVSIIVPVYNTDEKYLKKCLDDISAQTYANTEVIIVDDGSKKDTANFVDKYAQKNNWQVIHQKNGGLSSARNNGFLAAKGRYIQFLDSDDYFDPQLIEKSVAIAERESVDIVVQNFIIRNEKTGDSIEWISLVQDAAVLSEEPFKLKDIKEYRLGTVSYNAWSKLFRADFLRKNNIVHDESLYRSEDVVFSLQALLSADKIILLSQPLITYREELPSSNTATNDKFFNDSVDACEKVYSFLRKTQQYDFYEKDFKGILINSVFWHYEHMKTSVGRQGLASRFVTFLQSYDVILEPTERYQILTLAAQDEALVLARRLEKDAMQAEIARLQQENETLKFPGVKLASRKLLGAIRRRGKRMFGR